MKIFFKTPILLLTFNRSHTIAELIKKLEKIKPVKIYIAQDGPRNKEEMSKILDVRKTFELINWNCEKKFLLREKNLGCTNAVSGAITWFFDNEEYGIILEDDILPNSSFFTFCEELLEKYKNDEKIMNIGGFNILGEVNIKESYFFTKQASIWGWASWRRAWKKLTPMNKMNSKDIKNINLPKILNKTEELWWKEIFKSQMIGIKQGNDNGWDFQWTYSIWKNNGICILPQKNLVKNIGFGKYATHSTNVNDFKGKVKLNTLKFPLIHTQQYKINNTIEQKIFENTFNLKWYSGIIVLIGNITRKLGIYKYAYRIYEKLI